MPRLSALLAALCALVPSAQAQAVDDDLESLLQQEVETASAHRQQASEAAASVTVITADEIDRAGYRTLAELLGTVRGFYLTDDRSYARLGVRGLSPPSDHNNRVALFVDGVPVRDGFTDAAPVGLVLGVPLTAVDRVEVIRGPASTVYGTGAMFAVVNVFLKDTRTLDGVRAAVSVAEHGGVQGEVVAATDLPGGTGLSVAAYGLDEAGPAAEIAVPDALGGGVFAGDDFARSYGVNGAVERGGLRLDLRFGERTKGMAAGPYNIAFGFDAWTRDRSATAALRARADLTPRVAVEGTGALDHYQTTAVYPFLVDPTAAGPYEIVSRGASTVARAEARVRWDLGAAHRLTAGTEVLSQFVSDGTLDAVDQVFFETSDPHTSAAVFVQGESALTRAVSVTAGARFDAVRGDQAVAPRAAVVVAPSDRTALKVIAASAFRAPSSFERTLDAPFLGQVLAQDLRPERVASLEAAVTHEVWPGLRLDGSAFAVSARDLIENQLDPARGVTMFANADRARVRGAEAGAVAQTGGWRTRASYGYQYAWDPDAEADAEERLTNSPAHVAKATAFGPLGAGLWLMVHGRAESGRRTLLGTETDANAVVDAALSADVFGGLGRLTAGVRNALDADYAVPARPEHVLRPSIPQRPRTAYLRLDVRL